MGQKFIGQHVTQKLKMGSSVVERRQNRKMRTLLFFLNIALKTPEEKAF